MKRYLPIPAHRLGRDCIVSRPVRAESACNTARGFAHMACNRLLIGNYIRISACAGLLACAALFDTASFGAAKTGDAAKGKDTFASNCAVCHNADSAETKRGPGLKGLFKMESLVNKKKVFDANVIEFINKGSPVGMPAFEDLLSDRERADLLAYLKTL
jgi:mono/diheme cytochrome c family protein